MEEVNSELIEDHNAILDNLYDRLMAAVRKWNCGLEDL